MIERIEYVHSKNFIHRDIKPNNFMMGCRGDNSKTVREALIMVHHAALMSINKMFGNWPGIKHNNYDYACSL